MENLEREPEHAGVPESAFKAYLAGNARFPTVAFPFVILIADSVMFDEKFDPVSFARSQLNKKQMRELKLKVSRQHAHNDVRRAPVGYEDYVKHIIAEKIAKQTKRTLGDVLKEVKVDTITEAAFQTQWHTHANHTIGIVGALAGIRKDTKDKHFYSPFVYKTRDNWTRAVDDEALTSLAQEVALRLKDNNVRMGVQNVLRSFTKVLNGPLGKKMSTELRALKNVSKGMELNKELLRGMMTQYRLDMDADRALGRTSRVLTDEEVEAFRLKFLHA